MALRSRLLLAGRPLSKVSHLAPEFARFNIVKYYPVTSSDSKIRGIFNPFLAPGAGEAIQARAGVGAAADVVAAAGAVVRGDEGGAGPCARELCARAAREGIDTSNVRVDMMP